MSNVVVRFSDYQPRPKPAPYPPLPKAADIIVLPVVRIERGPKPSPIPRKKRKDA